jgi:polysaccharide export outer membrane protein
LAIVTDGVTFEHLKLTKGMEAMRFTIPVKIVVCGACFAAVAAWLSDAGNHTPSASAPADLTLESAVESSDVIRDDQIRLCQGYEVPTGQNQWVQASGTGEFQDGQFTQPVQAPIASRTLQGVDQFTTGRNGREGKWRDSQDVPWESMAYGEYIGPHRTPAVPEYRLRVNDQLELIYLRTREKSLQPYRLFVGDTIRISSAIDPSLSQPALVIRSDGMVSLSLIGQVLAAGNTIEDLQNELDVRYEKFVKNPAMVVQVALGETPLQDIINSVDARAGQGGQGRAATVSPDGTIQLPGLGSIPAIGLSLNELGREINARYQGRQGGIEVTPILTQRAPRFIYVVGEVGLGGRFELVGPTSVMQAIALADGFQEGGNMRQVVVFRRDQNWRLTATKLDLNGALLGKRPHPSDEIWLRDSDIVLVPKKPIKRLSEAVNEYLTNTVYSIYPRALLFNFDNFTTL